MECNEMLRTACYSTVLYCHVMWCIGMGIQWNVVQCIPHYGIGRVGYNRLHCITIQYNRARHNAIHWVALQHRMVNNTMHCVALHYITLHFHRADFNTLHYNTFHYDSVGHIAIRDITLHSITIQYTMVGRVQCNASHYISLH